MPNKPTPTFQPFLTGVEKTANKDQPNGYAGLDSEGNLRAKIQMLIGVSSDASFMSTVPLAGQPVFVTNTGKYVIGDGINTVTNLKGYAWTGANQDFGTHTLKAAALISDNYYLTSGSLVINYANYDGTNINLANGFITIDPDNGSTGIYGGLFTGIVLGTFASNFATDCFLANQYNVTLTGPITLLNPTNPSDGQGMTWLLKQDGTGGHTVSLDTAFVDPGGVAVALRKTPNKAEYLSAIYCLADDKWHVQAGSGLVY